MDFQILIYYFLIMMENSQNTEMNCQCTSWIGMGRGTVARALSQLPFFIVDRNYGLKFD